MSIQSHFLLTAFHGMSFWQREETWSIKWIGSSNPFPPTTVQVQHIMNHRMVNKIPATTLLAEFTSRFMFQAVGTAGQPVNCPTNSLCRQLNFDNLSSQSAEPSRRTPPAVQRIEPHLSHAAVIASQRKTRHNNARDSDDEDTTTSPNLLSKGYVNPLLTSGSKDAQLTKKHDQFRSSPKGISHSLSQRMKSSSVEIQFHLRKAKKTERPGPSTHETASKESNAASPARPFKKRKLSTEKPSN
ncbi:hypothetical protein C2S52_002842 [Perilla frutescens var. hirtella]|nr:hypothetical protein C2S52_002842 [Perilla frutescens var. hirtella]